MKLINRKRYITEWDRRHAWRVATRKCHTSLFAALGGAAGVALSIFTDCPPAVILGASLATYGACLVSGYYLAKRTIARE